VSTTPPSEEQILQVIRDKAGMDSDWRDLDIDSLDLVELVTALEDRFSIKIADGELKEISGVGDAVRLVSRLVGAGAVA
jgi:acyl carrier protein